MDGPGKQMKIFGKHMMFICIVYFFKQEFADLLDINVIKPLKIFQKIFGQFTAFGLTLKMGLYQLGVMVKIILKYK